MNKNSEKRRCRNNLRSGSHALRGVSTPRNESSLPKKSRVVTPTPWDEEWGLRIEELKRKNKGDEVREDEFQPTPQHLIGVVTHPQPSYQKDGSYPHQPLENPSHLWCNEVHATDADVMRGNRKKG